jgi:hypothetical protein
MSSKHGTTHCGRYQDVIDRRHFLATAGQGFGMLALASLLGRENLLASPPTTSGPWANSPPHFPAKARSVIWLFMEGGPSAMDTFDPKPELTRNHGKQPASEIDVSFGAPGPLMKSPYGFKRHGESGAWVCEHFEKLAAHVDDIAFIKSCHAESPNHAPAMYQMNTGMTRQGFPSAGSWAGYGLGTPNENLPGYVVLPSSRGSKGGPLNWGSGFLPSAYQGTTFRPEGQALLNLRPPGDMDTARQRRMLDLAGDLNRSHFARHPAEPDLLGRIQSYELAFQMQTEAEEAVDIDSEPEHIRKLYGLDDKTTAPYGRKCLMARRLVERGVRFVQVYCDGQWDAHGGLEKNHRERIAETDIPIAGLLADLKQRGLLEDTLVVWGGEFGRMPVSQRGSGRDHNPNGFLTWMAGGGVRGGTSHGETDEIGYHAAKDPVSVPDLHATMLHLLGLDHEKLVFRHNSRDYRLTDVSGKVIKSILA